MKYVVYGTIYKMFLCTRVTLESIKPLYRIFLTAAMSHPGVKNIFHSSILKWFLALQSTVLYLFLGFREQTMKEKKCLKRAFKGVRKKKEKKG